VTLSSPASVAVQCTSDTDPDEIFFAESATPATVHAVQLQGLLAQTAWSCTAAPTCPTQTGAATAFPWTTGSLPADLRRLTIEEDPKLGMGGPWTLAPFTLNSFGGTTWVVVWGRDGTPRWWHRLPAGVGMWVEALYQPAEDEIVWGGGMHEEGRTRRVSLWDGETWAFAPAGWEGEEFHHDGKMLEDGRILTLEIRPNQVGRDEWDGFGMRVVDPATDTVEWEFDSQTLAMAGLLSAGGGFNVDPWHANWNDYKETASGPMAYVSLCFEQQILAIDAATGSLAWQLGRDLGWTLLDVAGAPISEELLPQCQHGLEVDGDIVLVYDNGQDRNQSMAQEWRVDGITKTATLLWSWTEPGWSEDYIGDIDYLPNGRILVTEAAQFGISQIVEVDRATGAVASRGTLEDGLTYRAEQYAGCDLFDSTRECATLRTRYDEVSAQLQ
jgi:hypothetical protein